MNNKFIGVAVATSFLVAGSAFAQGPYYGGLELGSASVKDESQELASALVTVNGGSSSVTQDRGIGMFRIFGGYNFNRFVAAELGYLRTGTTSAKFSGVSGGAVAYSGTADLSITGLDLSAVFHPLADSAAKGLYLRAGITSYKRKIEVSGSNINGGSVSDSGSGIMLGVGYDLPAGPGDVRFSYTNLSSVAGISGADTNALSVGYLWKF